ncbi:MAG: radical SAM protein [archaeon]|nr:MAG: radical SAM protein [archaeon]
MPFDPIALAKETEAKAVDGNKRKYNIFRAENYYGQIATARGTGCNSRCVFCWINPSRDDPTKYGTFHTPQQVYDKLVEVSSNEFGRLMLANTARISGCEPTIGKDHLLSLIDLLKTKYDSTPTPEVGFKQEFASFLLETNGFLLGNDPSFIKALREFGDYVYVRLSFKAGTPEALERKTGVDRKAFELPFLALRQLATYKMNYRIAAMSSDPVLMPQEERRGLLESITNTLGFLPTIDEEDAHPFGITVKRLKAAGIIQDAEELGKQSYEDPHSSLTRVQDTKVRIRTDEGVITTDPPEALRRLIHDSELRTKEVDRTRCASCRNPWHGYDIEDDLDPKLG